jgi:predicted dehydrogenase
MSSEETRRTFVRTAAVAATAASYSRIMGANERVIMGLVGSGSRGNEDMRNFLALGNNDFIGVTDIYPVKIDQAQTAAKNAKGYNDHRKMLDVKEIDAVLIAVPDHWHSTIAIDALNAGKDVYCEKPLSLTIEEGPQIVKAARINNRVCQVGMQQRSGQHYLQAKAEYFDTNKLGKITLVRTWWHGNTYHLRVAPPDLKTQPTTLDWARFLGPVKWRDWDGQQYFNWRAYLDFGGGQITDLFTHWVDVVHMMIGQDIPLSAVASGGVYNYKDGRTAPDTINVLLEYPKETTVTFEATLVPGIEGAAIEFCGTLGRLWISRQRFEFTPIRQPTATGARPVPPVTTTVQAMGNMDRDHMQNFIDCIKSRKHPNADVLIGHRSAQASHLGNLAYLQKRRIDFDPIREEIMPH